MPDTRTKATGAEVRREHREAASALLAKLCEARGKRLDEVQPVAQAIADAEERGRHEGRGEVFSCSEIEKQRMHDDSFDAGVRYGVEKERQRQAEAEKEDPPDMECDYHG